MTQPKGYCTLAACQPGNCPSESVCVTFWQNTQFEAPESASTETSLADQNRLSSNYCMRKCDERSDCRDDEGYDCIRADEFGLGQEAMVEGGSDQKFCAVRIKAE